MLKSEVDLDGIITLESPSTANCVNVSDKGVSEMAKVDPRVSDLLLSTTIWHSDVLYYTSWYTVKKLIECIDCPNCVSVLQSNSESSDFCNYQNHLSLLSCEKYGNLIVPSFSVYWVVDSVDKKARRALCKWAYLSKETNAKILWEVLSETRNSTVKSLSQHTKESHILDGELRDDHISRIVKLIMKNDLILFWVVPINGPDPMAQRPNGTVVLSSRACLSRIPEYEFDRVFD